MFSRLEPGRNLIQNLDFRPVGSIAHHPSPRAPVGRVRIVIFLKIQWVLADAGPDPVRKLLYFKFGHKNIRVIAYKRH